MCGSCKRVQVLKWRNVGAQYNHEWCIADNTYYDDMNACQSYQTDESKNYSFMYIMSLLASPDPKVVDYTYDPDVGDDPLFVPNYLSVGVFACDEDNTEFGCDSGKWGDKNVYEIYYPYSMGQYILPDAYNEYERGIVHFEFDPYSDNFLLMVPASQRYIEYKVTDFGGPENEPFGLARPYDYSSFDDTSSSCIRVLFEGSYTYEVIHLLDSQGNPIYNPDGSPVYYRVGYPIHSVEPCN